MLTGTTAAAGGETTERDCLHTVERHTHQHMWVKVMDLCEGVIVPAAGDARRSRRDTLECFVVVEREASSLKRSGTSNRL